MSIWNLVLILRLIKSFQKASSSLAALNAGIFPVVEVEERPMTTKAISLSVSTLLSSGPLDVPLPQAELSDWQLHYGRATVHNCMLSDWEMSCDGHKATYNRRHEETTRM